MANKAIQEQRMKGYFIQAAKEILKGEGLKSVSVRNIADQAGYSYATLYNYFKDLKGLFFECIKEFQDECEEYVVNETKKVPRGAEKIKAISKAYAKYFIQYPSVFELFYLEKISDIEGKQSISDLICDFHDRLCAQEWDYCVKNEIVGLGQANSMRSILKYQVPGLLLLYLNRSNPVDYAEFMTILDKQLEKIVKTEYVNKKVRLFEDDIIDFILEDHLNKVCYVHYTKDEKVVQQILSEGFKYVDSFHQTAIQVYNDRHDLVYKHSMFKNYGKYVLVINISTDIYNFYSNGLKKDSKIKYHIENILTEQHPITNENGELVYILPTQFIKGYINHETGEMVTNPKFDPNYNPIVFAENLKQNNL